MTIAGRLRSLANYCLGPFDLTLERRSHVLGWQQRYVLRPSLFERALAGKPAPTVIDIGASIGSTVAEILAVRPDATVFAFEPRPDGMARMRERFGGNSHVHLYECGVGSTRGRMQLHVLNNRAGSSLLPLSEWGRDLAARAQAWEQSVVEVEVVTLDEWYRALDPPPEAIDLIKIDTQGFEKHVIAGGGQVLERAAFVIMEAVLQAAHKDQAVYDELIPSMRRLGYVVEAVSAGYCMRDHGDLLEVDVLLRRDTPA
jgi:FkbM family methyltransferase